VLSCIFACTLSKTLAPRPRLEARYYSQMSLSDAVEQWTLALQEETETTSVARLYKGGYWAPARAFIQDTPLPVEAHVASAGLGLRTFRQQVPAYAATFNPGLLDTIPGGATPQGQMWWWQQMGGSAAVRALAEGPDRRILVALPGRYLTVAVPDLLFLQQALGPRALSVFTTDKTAIDKLGTSAVPLDSRMSAVLGGTAGHVTVRALSHVVRQAQGPGDVTPGHARRLLEDVQKAAPDILYPKRQRQTEDQAAEWIRQASKRTDAPTSASAALRQFRNEGFAFEQKRFGRLFRSLKEEWAQ